MTRPLARYDPIITLGNVLTILSLIAGAVVFAIKWDERITVLEQIARDHDRRIGAVEHRFTP